MTTTNAPDQVWKLEDAKARFSELVRLARSEGPQRVTVRGQDSVVVIAAEEMDRLMPAPNKTPLVAFLEGLALEDGALDDGALDDLDLTREHDTGRDIAL